ncbi:Alpha-N-acetylneuraminide alpha-2,8-sialyltransferase, partial [Takifugu flavidus]
ENPLQLPLKKCAVVGNGGILRGSKCNLPPLSKEYLEDVGTKTHLVTANPSIIENRKHFVDSMKVYGTSYIYMPAFSMSPGTNPSLRAYYALADASANLTMLFANPEFLCARGSTPCHEEFVQLWHLHKSGTLRMRVGRCPPEDGGR